MSSDSEFDLSLEGVTSPSSQQTCQRSRGAWKYADAEADMSSDSEFNLSLEGVTSPSTSHAVQAIAADAAAHQPRRPHRTKVAPARPPQQSPQVSVPPGLAGPAPGSADAVPQASWTGKGKGSGPRGPRRPTPAVDSDEITKIWARADDGTRRLLQSLGASPPLKPSVSLEALCKQHIDDLPQSIRDALLELEPTPPPAPTMRQELDEAARAFKTCTNQLRALIGQKAALQQKLDRMKQEYLAQLQAMKELTQALQKKTEEVACTQSALQTKMHVGDTRTSLDMLSTLEAAGITLSADQVAAVQRVVQGHGCDDATRLALLGPGALAGDEQTPANLLADPGTAPITSPPAPPEATTGPTKRPDAPGSREGRSRSPVGGKAAPMATE